MTYASRLIASSLLAGMVWPAAHASALERLCDPAHEDCRAPLIELIRNESAGIDVAFWFMEDSRYANELVKRWQAGVPVRVLMDTEANSGYPLNADMLKLLKDAGIPMREKTSGGILHWKTMLFAGQNTVQFSGANYSSNAFVPVEPYVNYVDETIYFTDDPNVVNSFKTKYDDVWTTTSGYSNYANVVEPLVRVYPAFEIDPELNFPPGSSSSDFAKRSVKRYDAETVGIDAIMYRITDRRHTDALINARARGLPIRLISEPFQYRDATRLWHSWNVDRLYMAGVQIRHRKHAGLNHEKLTLLQSQGLTIFGSSNWTSPSANSQLEHNYFTTKPWFLQWARDHFERKWHNSTGHEETEPFVPLPPDTPAYRAPADAAQNQHTTVTLKWYGGPWAHKYDVYFGPDPANLLRVATDLTLGPSESATQYQSFDITGLDLGVTYYWKVVSKTMADLTKAGPVWSFRTTGETPKAGDKDAVLYASKAPVVVGNWSVVADSSAAGGARLSNPNLGAAKLSAPLESPADYFEMKFYGDAGVAYRIWIRGKAASNSWANDSVFVQFSDSVTSTGSPTYRIGTTSGTSVTIEDCSGCGLSNWGWNDNGIGTGVLGPLLYFETTGEHAIRVQVREDGLSIDQIVMTRDKFLDAAPGLTKNDGTILAESPGVASDGSSPPPPPPDIVLHTAYATLAGAWMRVDDAVAASGKAAVLPDAGRAKVNAGSTALIAPADYFELTFTAVGNVDYRLWIRGRAHGNSAKNDSVHVQFTDTVDGSGNPLYRIGTTSSVEVNLEDCSGCGNSGWGWEDNGWGAEGLLGPTFRFVTDGVKTIRVQNREDGFYIDQIVLSPYTYLNSAPGANKDDSTILPATDTSGGEEGEPPPPPPPDAILHTAGAVLAGAWQIVDDAVAASGKAAVLPDAGRAKVTAGSSVLENPSDFFELTFEASGGTAYRIWLRGRAEGNSPSNDSVHLQFTDTVDGAGNTIYRIGTTSSVEVNLEDCSGCGNSGWGWEDNGWGAEGLLGPEIRFATDGVKTIRVQNREDGFSIDQIVLSASTYLTTSPGANKDDTTILDPSP